MSLNLRDCLPIYYYRGDGKNIFNPSDFRMKNTWSTQKQYLKQVILLRNALSPDNFNDTIFQFMNLNEGCVLHPYVCAANVITVGVGLALRKNESGCPFAPLAVAAFRRIGRDLNNEYRVPGLLEEHIREKKPIISESESLQLLSFVIEEHTREIQAKYFNAAEWSRIPLPLRVTLHSLYYHNPVFLRGQMERGVRKLLQVQGAASSCVRGYQYSEEGKDALKEILIYIAATMNRGAPYNGSPVGTTYWESIQNRRWREMIMASIPELDKENFPEIL